MTPRPNQIVPGMFSRETNLPQRTLTSANPTPNSLEKIPFDRFNDQAVRTEDGETDQNQNGTAASQPYTNESVAPHFKQSANHEKNPSDNRRRKVTAAVTSFASLIALDTSCDSSVSN